MSVSILPKYELGQQVKTPTQSGSVVGIGRVVGKEFVKGDPRRRAQGWLYFVQGKNGYEELSEMELDAASKQGTA